MAKSKRKEQTSISRFLHWLNFNCHSIRDFAFHNRNFFEIMFLLAYTLEQVILIAISSSSGNDSALISYFALIVLFTFGVHKAMMESRVAILEGKINEYVSEKNVIECQAERIVDEHGMLVQAHKKVAR